MNIHLPAQWGRHEPACGAMGPRDETLTDRDEIEDVTCPVCAGIVIAMTVSDGPKARY